MFDRQAHKVAYRKRYPEKWKAQKKLARAVARGTVEKPTACLLCREGGRIEGHHYDYSKPYDVVWLCARCHRFVQKHIPTRSADAVKDLFLIP